MNNNLNKIIIVSFFFVVIAVMVGVFFFLTHRPTNPPVTAAGGPGGFVPLNRTLNGGGAGLGNQNNASSTVSGGQTSSPVAVLRLLSDTPVGGYGSMATGTKTIIQWIDRGRGNIYQTQGDISDVTTLSNTIFPRVYNSAWSKDLGALVGSTLSSGGEPSSVYAALIPIATTTNSTSTAAMAAQSALGSRAPFILKGNSLPQNTIAFATSPKKDKIFFLVKSDTGSTGYIANFDGSKVTQIFTTPLTQIVVEWPATNTIAITTKGAANQKGFLYFVNPTTGVWAKILGPLNGLSARVSHDAKYVAFSVTGQSQNTVLSIYNVAKTDAADVPFGTLADKCAWGNFYKNMLYCGVPFQNVPGVYPDDWYQGTLSTVDKIWQINAETAETHQINQLIGQAGRPIDAFTLGLDDKDNYLFFMNKGDLSLWSLDLVRSN